MVSSLFEPSAGREVIAITPDSAGWAHLGFEVVSLSAGEAVELDSDARESAVVVVSGRGVVEVGGERFELARRGVFDEMAPVLYVPPGTAATLAGSDASGGVFAIGSAPASGLHPIRLFEPAEMEIEIRGGGSALRQVNHVLAPPLPAERLIVFEVFVPGGSWAGWPAHCHDGRHGSPYLEETYYFRFDRPEGFGFHRNYLDDGSFDEAFAVRDGDCVAVPRGYHVTTAAPGSNMWILNFLAGKPIGEQRAAPPYFDPATTWITEDWSKGQTPLPVVAPAGWSPGGTV